MPSTASQNPTRIPLAEPDLRGNEAVYLEACVRTNWVSSAGRYVTELEERMAAQCGRASGVATVNGTAAIYLALRALGIGPGDKVIVPDFTFAATANAVLQTGAAPVFVDVDEVCWGLSSNLTAEAIAAGRVKAAIAVHALGHPADMDPLMALAGEAGIPVIEDAAGAIGATYKGRPAGGLGDAAIFSFNGNKTVTAGGGGMIVFDDRKLADRARALSAQAREGSAYRYTDAGTNLRMTNLNAAVGVAQMERLDEMLAAKRAIAGRYDATVKGRNDLSPMPRADWAESACWLYSVRCASRADAASLVADCAAAGIEARTFWESLSPQPPYAGHDTFLDGTAEALSGTVVSLPCSSSLNEADQARVIATVAAWHGDSLEAAA